MAVSPLKTSWVREQEMEQISNFVERQIQEGRQAYMISPLIEESEHLDAKRRREFYSHDFSAISQTPRESGTPCTGKCRLKKKKQRWRTLKPTSHKYSSPQPLSKLGWTCRKYHSDGDFRCDRFGLYAAGIHYVDVST